MKDELLTIQQAANLLGVSTRTLRRWEHKGHLKPQRTIGNQRRYKKAELTELFTRETGKAKLPTEPSLNFQAPIVQPAPSLPQTPVQISSQQPIAQQTEQKESPVVATSSFEPTQSKFPSFRGVLVAGAVLGMVLFMGIAMLIAGSQQMRNLPLSKSSSISVVSSNKSGSKTTENVLAAQSHAPAFTLNVNIPGVFGQKVTFLDTVSIKKALTVAGLAQLNGGIKTNNANINAGTGKLTASNVIYSINPGTNITITGDRQNPIISASVPSSVTSFQGATGAIELADGTGISISGTTITNSDPGSAQNIFKTFSVDGTDIAAGNNNDTVNFAAGSGITLSGDAGSKTITITNDSSGTLSGLTPNGVLYALTSSSASTTIPGTTGTVLHGITGGAPVFSAVDLTADVTGVLQAANGGTGSNNATPGQGEVLIGNGTGFSLSTLTAGSGIGVTNGAGTITLTNSGVLSLTGTSHEVNVSGSTGAIILTLPQPIDTTSTPSFASLNLTNATNQLRLGSGNTGLISIATLTSGRTYTFPDASGTVCLTSGNCSGSGGTLTGSGSVGFLSEFTSPSGIGDSILYDNGKIGLGTTSPQGLFSVSGAVPGLALVDLNQTGDQNILVGSSSGSTRFVFDQNGNLSLFGGAYQIGGTNVLSSTTLGSTVINSSLTGVGALTSGSIASGFGTIDTGANSISGGNITSIGAIGYSSSGNGAGLTFSGSGNHIISASTGVLELGGVTLTSTVAGGGQSITGLGSLNGLVVAANTGVVTSGTWHGTVIGSQYGGTGTDTSGSTGVPYISNGSWSVDSNALSAVHGGTGQTSYALGDILYADSTTTLARRAIGGDGQILTVSGGVPVWSNVGGTINFWQEALGAVEPLNITDDLLLGSTASNSAKFAFENVAGGVPTASISAGTANNNTYLTGSGTLATTDKQTLTLGSASTGNLALFGFGSGVVHTNGSGIVSTSPVSLTADVTGTLQVTNGGTGVGSFGGTNTLLYTSTANTLSSIATGNNGVLVTDGGGVPSISSTLPNAVQSNITRLGTITNGVWNGTAIGATFGGTGQTAYAVGDLLYADTTTTLAKLPIGGNNNCLVSNGTTPHWAPCSAGGTNYWQESLGAIAPLNITDDLLLGATATNSAKFAFINNTGAGTPTASISAGTANNNTYLTGSGTLATTDKQTLTLGSASTGNLDLFGFGSGVLHTNGSGVVSTSPVSLTADVSGILPVGNGGTGVGTFGGTNTLLFTSSADTLSSIATGNNGVLITGGGGAPSISSTLPNAVQLNITSLGTIGTGVWNGTAIGATFGGTGQTGYAVGDLLYADTTTTLAKLPIGSNNNCLVSNGTTPHWAPCSGLGTNYWQESLGAIAPLNITDDLLLGATATNSAKFAFENVAGGVPTASISAGTANNYTYITGDGSLATTDKQTLTLGSSSTGNIDLFGFGSGIIHSTGGILSSSAVALGGSDVSGTLGVSNGGTGVGSFGGTNTLLYTSAANTLSSIATANNGVLITGSGGAPSISSTLPNAVQLNITSLGTIGTGVWNGSVIGTGFGGTGQTTYTDGQLLIGNSTGNTLAKATLTQGTGISITNGHGSITIAENPSSLSKFTENDALGVLYPNISTLDVLFGGTATSSAKFAFLNNAGGTPVASVSATAVGTGLTFSGDGSIQSLINGNLTLGGTTTGNILLSPLNGAIGAYVAPSTNGQVDLGTSSFAFRNIYASSDVQVNGISVCLANGTHCPSGGTNYWDQLNGALTPKNETLDLLLGSQASTSAKFAFINVNSGTPTASISANTANNFTYLTGDGTLATTDKQTLTLGSASTGSIGLFNFGAGAVMTDANGFLSSGTLPVGDGGTGLASIASGALVYGSGGSSLTAISITGSIGECLVSTGSAPQWQNCPGGGGGTSPFTLSGNTVLPNNTIYQLGLGTTTVGDVTSELYVTRNLADGALGKALGIFNQTENQDILTASASGVAKFTIANNGDINATGAISGLTGLTSSGQIKFTGAPFTANNAVLVGTAGTGVISSITTNTSNLCIVSGLSGPSWNSCSGLGTNFWQENLGAVAPLNITDDLLLGATATNSAKFAFENVAGGVPTASISAGTANNSTYLTGAGVLGTTNRETLALGSLSTGNILIDSPTALSLNATSNAAITTGTGSTTLGGTLTVNGTTVSLGNASSSTIQTTGANTGLTLLSNGTGNITLGQPVGNGTILINPNAGGQASLIIKNSGSGDLLTASAGAVSKFTVANNGDIHATGAISGLTGLSSSGTINFGGLSASLPVFTDSSRNLTNTGVVDVAHGGTGVGSFGGTNTLLYTSAANTLSSIATGNNGVLITDAGGTPSISSTLPTAVQGNITSLGTIGTGIWQGTAIGATFGGTGQTAYAVGDLLYADTTTTLAKLPIGGNNNCLVSNGTTPHWTPCSGLGINYWQENLGAVAPLNITDDLLVGGIATTSAKFAFINSVGAGVPTASISAGTANNNTYLTGSGTLATTDKQTLTLGSASTGNLDLFGFGSGVLHTNGSGVVSTSPVSLTADVSGILPVGNGGTGVGTFGGTNTLLFTSSADTLSSIATGNNGVLITGGGGAPSISSTLPSAVQDNITRLGTITNGVWHGTAIGATFGGTGQTAYAVGDLLYADTTTTLAKRAIGTTGQILTVSGGVPVWSSAGGTINFWQENLGAVAPLNITDDLLLGATATNSAKFAFENVAGGVPTASISAGTANNYTYITGDGSLATTDKQTLTLGSASTGNLDLFGFGSGVLHTNGSGVVSTSPVSLTADVSGILPVGNGGTGVGSFGGTNTLLYTSAANTLSSIATGNNGVLITDAGGTPSISSTLPTAVQGNITSLGTIGTGIWQGTAIGATFGGTGQTAYAVGDLLYADTTTTLAKLPIGGNNNCLVSNGTTPHWTPCSGLGINYWQENLGAVAPLNITDDLLLGATATNSAKFAFINNTGAGTPTASISAGTANNNTYLTGSGTLATTDKQTLTLGSASTGNLDLFGFGSGVLHTNGSGVVSTSPVSLTADVSGILPVGNGGTGVGTFGGTNTLLFTSSADTLSSIATGNNGVLITGGGGAPSISSTLPSAVQDNITRLGTITNGVWHGTAIGALYGGTGTDTSSSTGVPYITAGAWSVDSNALAATHGGTGQTGYAVGDLLYADTTTTLAKRAIGTSGQILTVSGGVPVWSNVGGTINFWQENLGAVAPLDITNDLLLGATATNSAKFAFENVAGGVPTASISANTANNSLYISGDGSVATTDRETLTLGSASTGNITLSPMGGSGVVTSTGTFNLSGGKTYQIGGTDVLSSTILGTGVITSSLTTVGALTGGSIASGFGTIATANTITGTTLNGTTGINTGAGAGTNRIDSSGDLVSIVNTTTSGTVQFSHFGTGIAHLDSTGILSSSAVDLTTSDVANILPTGHGGTGYNTYLTGDLLYGNGSSSLSKLGIGTAGQILTISSGAPQWENVGGTVNFWQEANGAVAPLNITDDLLLGATATTSAKFAFANVAGGTPVASIAANPASGTTNGLALVGNGTIQSLNMNTLTIGGSTTGSIVIDSGSDVTQFNDNTLSLAGSAPKINSTTNVLSLNTVSNEGITTGTGLTALGGNLQLDGGNILDNNAMTRLTLNNGNLGINTSTPFALLDVRGTNGINPVSGTVGVASISGQTSFASLLVDNAGLGDLFTASKSGATKFSILNNGNIRMNNYIQSGGVLYTDGAGNVSQAIAGGSGQVLQLVGSVPTWVSAGTAGINVWQEVSGALSPYNITDDLLLGGTATTSAKFAFINNTGAGIPTASISAGTANNNTFLTGAGTLGTTNRQTLSIGSASTGNIAIDSPTALSLNTTNGAAITTGTGLTTLGGSLTVNGATISLAGTNPTVSTTSNNSLTISGAGSGNLILGQNSGNGTVLIQPNGGGQASLIVKNQGSGDLFTASAGATPKFTIQSNGNIVGTGAISGLTGLSSSGTITFSAAGFQGNNAVLYGTAGSGQVAGVAATSTANQCLLSGLNTAAPTWGSCALGTNYWQLNGSVISPATPTNSLAIGTTTSFASGLDARALNTTQSVASVSGSSNFANLVVDQSGTGDIFTASKSGATKFVITNSGNVGIGTNTPATQLELSGSTGTASLGNLRVTSSTIDTGISMINTGYTNPFTTSSADGFNAGDPINSHFVGEQTVYSTSVSSGGYAILGSSNASGAPAIALEASQGIGSTSRAAIYLNAAGLSGSSNGAISNANNLFQLANNGSVLMTVLGSGAINVVGGQTSDLDTSTNTTLKIGATSATTLTLGRSTQAINLPGYASANNSILFADSTANGALTKVAATSTQNQCLLSGLNTAAPTWGTCALGTNYWQLVGNVISPATQTNSLAIGTTTSLASGLDVRGLNATQPVASVSGSSNFANLVVDQSGTGDIFTASKSGATKFVINNNGNVGIGTAIAGATLDIQSNSLTTTNAFNVSATALTSGNAAVINVNGTNTLTSGQALQINGPTSTAAISNNSGLVKIITSGALTGTAGSGTHLDIIGDNTLTATLASISDASIMTGTGELLSLTAGAATTTTNGLFNINGAGLTTGFAQVINVNGTNTLTNGGALNIVGPTGAAAIGNNFGLVQINSSGALTTTAGSGGLLDIIGNGTITGTLASISDSSIMTGNGELLSLTAGAATTTTNGLFNINGAGLTTGFAEKINANGVAVLTNGGALDIVGPTGAAAIGNNFGLVQINSSGALTTTAGSGGLLDIIGNGTITGTLASISDSSIMTGNGELLSLTAGAATTTTNGLFNINGAGLTTGFAEKINANGVAVLTNGGALDIVGPTGAAAIGNNFGLVQINSSGALTTTAGSGGLLDIIGNGTITGTLASISDSSIMTGTGELLSLTAGAATTTTNGLFNINGAGLTTGFAQVINVNGTNTLTNGGALNIVGPTGAAAIGNNFGLVQINSSGALTTTAGSGGLLDIIGNGTITGTLASISDSSIMTGTGELLSLTAGAATTTTNGLFNINGAGLTTGFAQVINVNGTNTLTNGGALNIVGPTGAAAIGNNFGLVQINSSGALTTTAGSGGLLDIIGNGTITGTLASISDSSIMTGNGELLSLTAGAATTTTNGLFNINGAGLTTGFAQVINVNGTNTLTNGGALDIVGPTGAAAIGANKGLVQINSSGALTTTAGSGGLLDMIGNGTITGTLASISDSSIMTTTGNLLYLTADTATTTTGLETIHASGLTTGWALNITAPNAITTTGNVGINTSTALATLDVRGTSGTTPVASVSGLTAFAAAIVDNSGVGDLFTASKSGATKFVITNAGNVGIGTATPQSNLDITGGLRVYSTDRSKYAALSYDGSNVTLNASGQNVVFASPLFNAGGTFDNGSNTLTDIGQLGVGTTATNLATADIRATNGTIAVASISGKTSFAGLVVDNSGVGDILTASASGLTRFTVKNNGVVVIGNATNGITFDPTGTTTAIYTGTAQPTKQIILSPEYAGAVLTASGSAQANGFMTSDASPSASPSTYNFENYYQWQSTQTTQLQQYTVAVRVTLPKDFSAWAASNPVQVDYNTSTTSTNSNLNIYLYNPSSSNSIPVAYHQSLVSSGPWATNTITPTELNGTTNWNTAGQTAVFYMTMQAQNSAYVQIGDIKLTYRAQF